MPATEVLSGTTIVGAGIVGICCALALLEKGENVTLIDRCEPAEGASSGNAGVISPWSCIPQSVPGLWRDVPKWLLMKDGPISVRWDYLPWLLPWTLRFFMAGTEKRLVSTADAMHALNRPNVEIYRHHLKGTGNEDLLKDSFYVHVFRDARKADLDGLTWRLRAERGAPMEAIDGAGLHELEPDLSEDFSAAIVIKDQARAFDPGMLGKVLAEKAFASGASFIKASVDMLVQCEDGTWTLQTDNGAINANTLVMAAGAWSARLLKPLGLRLPLEAERGYHVEFREPGVSLRNSIMDADAKFVASSMAGGIRAAGSAEFAGLDTPANDRRAKMFIRLAKNLLPGLNTSAATEWMGTRPSFPDSLPAVGAIDGHRNLLAAFGHSHYGLGMAPATGRIIADLVTTGSSDVDLDPYRPGRFG